MDARRGIPAVERLLASAAFADLAANAPRSLIVDTLQHVQHAVRSAMSSGTAAPHELPSDIGAEEWYAARVHERIAALRSSSLQRVINATGVVLHTNLGRAPLADAAVEAMREAAMGYTTLEYDVARGRRGSRYDHCARLLRTLTGAADALVVNNNAAALVLALNTFARGRDVPVSRGELVEIGGSFRVPDIMKRSGARLIEVGATNRTHPPDYQEAITKKTGALLKVHRSNFRVEGYTAEVSVAQLSTIALEAAVPLVYDLGSGLLYPDAIKGFEDEPSVRTSLADGATIVALSGDKLLGGPQAGILVGDAAAIAAMRRNPLCRALRPDKLTLAALQATLLLHLDPARARQEIPVLRMLSLTQREIATRAERVLAILSAAGVTATLEDGQSEVGGGSAPGFPLPTTLLRVERAGRSAASIERRLRDGAPPIVARVEADGVLIDLRTVQESEEQQLCDGVIAAAGAQ